MFTDRFIKVPSKIYNSKEVELTGNAAGIPLMIRILPMEVCEYYPSKDDAEPDVPCVQVVLKNGESLMVYLQLHEFEKLINDHA